MKVKVKKGEKKNKNKRTEGQALLSGDPSKVFKLHCDTSIGLLYHQHPVLPGRYFLVWFVC